MCVVIMEHSLHVQSSPDGLLHEEGEEPEGEELMAKKEQFKNKLKTYCDSKGKRVWPQSECGGETCAQVCKMGHVFMH